MLTKAGWCMCKGFFGLALVGLLALQPAHALTADDAAERLLELVTAGVGMEQYRHAGTTEALQTCGDLMRANQADARALRTEIAGIPGVDIDLLAAAVSVERCVSCLPTAAVACGEVEDLLDELEE